MRARSMPWRCLPGDAVNVCRRVSVSLVLDDEWKEPFERVQDRSIDGHGLRRITLPGKAKAEQRRKRFGTCPEHGAEWKIEERWQFHSEAKALRQVFCNLQVFVPGREV